MDELPLSVQKSIFTVRQNPHDMPHMFTIRLQLHGSKEHLTRSKLHHKEQRAANQLTAYKKLNRKEITGCYTSQWLLMNSCQVDRTVKSGSGS
jgi:hypothetical protein